jgi:hypothetical protein
MCQTRTPAARGAAATAGIECTICRQTVWFPRRGGTPREHLCPHGRLCIAGNPRRRVLACQSCLTQFEPKSPEDVALPAGLPYAAATGPRARVPVPHILRPQASQSYRHFRLPQPFRAAPSGVLRFAPALRVTGETGGRRPDWVRLPLGPLRSPCVPLSRASARARQRRPRIRVGSPPPVALRDQCLRVSLQGPASAAQDQRDEVV